MNPNQLQVVKDNYITLAWKIHLTRNVISELQ